MIKNAAKYYKSVLVIIEIKIIIILHENIGEHPYNPFKIVRQTINTLTVLNNKRLFDLLNAKKNKGLD